MSRRYIDTGGLYRAAHLWTKGATTMIDDATDTSYQQISEIIRILADFHRRAAEICRLAAMSLTDEKQSLLLATLADRQRRLVGFCEEIRDEASDNVSATWSQFVPREPIETLLAQMQRAEICFEELVDLVLRFQNEITALIQVVGDGPSSPAVQEFLESLAIREYADAKFISEAELGMDDA